MAIGDSYAPTVWVDEETVINAAYLNKIENRIKELEDAASLISGKLPRARLEAAGKAATDSNATRGGVTLDSSINSTVEAGVAATPKAVNDARLSCASIGEVINGDTRKATLAGVAEKFKHPVNVNLSGGVSIAAPISINSAADLLPTQNINVTVLPEQHKHQRSQILNSDATASTTGFCKPVKSIEGKEIGKTAITEVAQLDVAIKLNNDLKAMNTDLSTGINNNSKLIRGIIELSNTTIAAKPLGELVSTVDTLNSWKQSFTSSTNMSILTLNQEIFIQKEVNKNFAAKNDVEVIVREIESLNRNVELRASKAELRDVEVVIRDLTSIVETAATKDDVQRLKDNIYKLAQFVKYPGQLE